MTRRGPQRKVFPCGHRGFGQWCHHCHKHQRGYTSKHYAGGKGFSIRKNQKTDK